MHVNYELLKQAVAKTIRDLRDGHKSPDRARKLELQVVANLESEVATGEFTFGVDAAIDAGGNAKHPRPMDYVLGGLLSCQHMWCLRWAALANAELSELKIAAVGKFTWRGEYLDEVDAGLTSIDVRYHIGGPDLSIPTVIDMCNTVARRCPVFATLRRAVTISEDIVLNDKLISRRKWFPDQTSAVTETI